MHAAMPTRSDRPTLWVRFALAVAAVAVSFTVRAADIVLHQQAAPVGSIVRLADVATVQGAEEDVARLGAAPLMPSPAPGTTQTVRAQAIRELLIAQGFDLSSLRFDGAVEVEIAVAGSFSAPAPPRPLPIEKAEPFADSNPQSTEARPRVSAPAIETNTQPITKPLPQTGFRIPVAAPAARQEAPLSPRRLQSLREGLLAKINALLAEPLSQPLVAIDVKLPADLAALLSQPGTEATAQGIEAPAVGDRSVELSWRTATGAGSINIVARLEAAVPVAFVARSLPRGARLGPTDFELRRVALSAAPSDAVGSVAEADGMEASAPLRAGAPLLRSDLAAPLLVERGGLVTVIAGSDGVRVRMQGTAKSEGRLGDLVQVMPLGSKEAVLAQVTGRGELAVGAAISTRLASRSQGAVVR